MSTRSTIGCKMPDGSYRSIYCHFDGYPSGVGKILRDHYNSQEGAELVTSLGDLSTLEPSMECPDGHTFDNPKPGYSRAYGRDRGETRVGTRIHPDMESRRTNSQEYDYTWTGEGWIVSGRGIDDVPLSEAIDADE